MVLDRDGWRCQMCGVKTPKRLRGTFDDRAPELDHRVPMAMGGGHVWDNVQCSCRRCNAAKNAMAVLGQTNLFPTHGRT
jgi:5-methylcytosine-specific restriction endonuclease McrA